MDHITTMKILYNTILSIFFISSALALSLEPMIQNYPIMSTGVYSKIETRVYQDTSVSDIYWICSAFLTSTGGVTIEKRRFWVGVDVTGLGPVELITQPDNLTYIDIDVVDSVSECQFALLTATAYLVGPPFVSVAKIGMKQIEVTANDTLSVLPFFLSTTSFIPPSPPFNSSQYLGYVHSMDSASYPLIDQVVCAASKGMASQVLLLSSTGTSFSSLNEGLNPTVILWPDQTLLACAQQGIANSGIFCFRTSGGSEVFTRIGTASNQYTSPVISRMNDTTGSMSVLRTSSAGPGYEVIIIDKLGNAATDLSVVKDGPTSVTHTSLDSYVFVFYNNNSKIFADVLYYNSTIIPPPVPEAEPIAITPTILNPTSAPMSEPLGSPTSTPTTPSTPESGSTPPGDITPNPSSSTPQVQNESPSGALRETNETVASVTDGPSNEISASILGPAIAVPIVIIGLGVFLLVFFLKKRNRRRKQENAADSKPSTSSDVLPLTDVDKSGSGGEESKYRAMSTTLNLSAEPGSKPMTMKTIQPADVDKRMYIPYHSLSFTREIGAGSYGKVFLGEWRGAQVAIKVSNSTSDAEGFLSEAKLTLGITPHPNLVQTFGVSTDGPNSCIILEYCGGGSLDGFVFNKQQTITDAQRKEYALKIAYGLLHLHNNHIVHRDLAARNILLTNDRQPKISDFGMSRIVRDQAAKGKTKTSFGPIRWMAPESLKDRSYSTKSDVWSYGILLWELAAGREPHDEEDQLSIAIKIRDQGFVPVIPDNCDPALRHVMEMCWKMSPAERPSMEEVANYLRTH
jgi:predicted Ser/Thr protein kinase